MARGHTSNGDPPARPPGEPEQQPAQSAPREEARPQERDRAPMGGPDTETATKPPVKRRFRRAASILALVLVTLVSGAYLARNRLLAPLIVQALERALARRYPGTTLTIEQTAGDWWRSLEIRGLKLHADAPDFEIRALEIEHAIVRFDLAQLLSNLEKALATCTVRARGIRIELALQNAATDTARRKGDGGFRFPTHWPGAHIEDASLEIALEPTRTLLFDGITLETSGERDREQAFSLSVEHARWIERGHSLIAGKATASGRYRAGLFALERFQLQDGRDTLRLRGNLDLSEISEQRLGWTARGTLFGGALETTGVLARDRIGAWLEVRDLALASLARRFMPERSESLGGTLTTHARADLDLASLEQSRAALRVWGKALRWRTRPATDLELGAIIRERAVALSLQAEQPKNHLEIERFAAPLEPLEPLAMLSQAQARVRVEISDLPALLPHTPLAEPPPHHLHLSLAVADGMLSATDGRFEVAGGRFDLERLALEVPTSSAVLEAGPRIAVAAKARFPELQPVGRLLADTSQWQGALEGEVRAVGRGLDLEARLELEGRDVAVDGYALGRVAIDARGLGGRWELRRVEIDGPLLGALVQGRLDRRRRTLEQLSAKGRIRDLKTLSAGIVDGDGMDFELTASGPFDRLDARLEAASTLVVLPTVLPSFPFTDLELDAHTNGTRFSLDRFRATSPAGTLELHARGRFDPQRQSFEGTIERLAFAQGSHALVSSAPAALTLSAEAISLSPLRLAGTAGRLALEANADRKQLAGKLSTEALDLTAFVRPWIEEATDLGALNLTCEVRAPSPLAPMDAAPTPPSFPVAISANATLNDLYTPPLPRPVTLRLALSLSEGRLSLTHLLVTEGEAVRLHASGFAPLGPPRGRAIFADGPVRFEGYLEPPPFEELFGLAPRLGLGPGGWIGGRLRARFRLEGTWRALRGEVSLLGEEIELDTSTRPLFSDVLERERGFGPARLALRARLDEHGLTLEQARLESPFQMQLEASGMVGLPADVTRWQLDRRFWDRLPIAFGMRLRVETLRWLAALTTELRRVDGRLGGRLQVGGRLGAPLAAGTLSLRGGEVRLSGALPALEQLEAKLNLNGERLHIPLLRGELGAAPFTIGGTIELAEHPRLDLELHGRDLLLYRALGVKVRADTDLHIGGRYDALEIKGEARLTDARYVKRIELLQLPFAQGSAPSLGEGIELFSITEPPLADARFDVAIRSEQPFVIHNNLVNGAARVDLRLSGTGRVPVLLGSVFLEPTQIRLPTTVLTVHSGTVRFEEDDPFVPRLDLQAQTRMLGYDITAVIEGRYDAFETTLSSVPPLSQTDLLTLLLTGRPPADDDPGRTGLRAGQAVAVYLARDVVAALFDEQSTEAAESVLDRLSIELGRDVTRSGGETVEIKFRLLDRIVSERDALYLTAEQDAYDHFGGGLRLVFRFR